MLNKIKNIKLDFKNIIIICVIFLALIGIVVYFSSLNSQKILNSIEIAENECGSWKNPEAVEICYFNYALDQKSVVLCDKIIDENTMNECYRDVAQAKKDVSICDQIPLGIQKSACYFDLAQIKMDSSICEKNINPEYNNKNNCIKCAENVGQQEESWLCPSLNTAPAGLIDWY